MACAILRTGERLALERTAHGIKFRAAIKVDGQLSMYDYIMTPAQLGYGLGGTLALFREVRRMVLGSLRAFGGIGSIKPLEG